MDVPGEPPELTATHPLLSLVAAVFWVLRTWFSYFSCCLPYMNCSMAFILGKVTHCVRNNICAAIYLCHSVVFSHIYCTYLFIYIYIRYLTVLNDTLQLNFWSFVIIFIASAVALNYFIRFRYLNVYTTLKEPPLVKSDAKELHPDVNTTETPPNFHNYLDDFLEAVRIFGFLEKPVCFAFSVTE